MLVSSSTSPSRSRTIDHTPAFSRASSIKTNRNLRLRSRIVHRRSLRAKISIRNVTRESRTHFWDLPPELRLQIYGYLVLTRHVLVHCPIKKKRLSRGKADHLDLKFTRTSRRMYEEVKDLFYRENCFHIVEPTEKRRIAAPNSWPVKYLKQAKRFQCNLTLDVNDQRRGCWQTTMRNAFRFLSKLSGIASLHLKFDLGLSPHHTGAREGAYDFAVKDIESTILMLEDVRVEDYAKIEFQNHGKSVVIPGDGGLDHEPNFHQKLQAIAERLESTMRGEHGPVVGTQKQRK